MKLLNEVLIEAPPETVWRVTCDVEHWPEWTPTVTSATIIDGYPFDLGSSVRIKQPGQPASEWLVTEFIPGARFTWESRRSGMCMVATHELIPDGAGTRSVLRLDATGPLAVILWPVLRLTVPRALSLENAGLKNRCEALARDDLMT
jgi:uncharacterized protein YndB with AHSA1/START domain